MSSAVGVIPARFGSSRFPGKPLVDLAGKPMIQRVAERARCAKSLSRVLVATDNRRIFKAVIAFGGEAVMTPAGIPSGTDRVAHVAKSIDADVFVNIQGDEPMIEPDEIDAVVRLLQDNSHADVGTLVKKIEDPADSKVRTRRRSSLTRAASPCTFPEAPFHSSGMKPIRSARSNPVPAGNTSVYTVTGSRFCCSTRSGGPRLWSVRKNSNSSESLKKAAGSRLPKPVSNRCAWTPRKTRKGSASF